MNQNSYNIKSKLTIIKNKISKEETCRVKKTFEIKFLTPPKISSSLKSLEKKSNSPPRFRNYDNFSVNSSNSLVNPAVGSFPIYRPIPLVKLQGLRRALNNLSPSLPVETKKLLQPDGDFLLTTRKKRVKLMKSPERDQSLQGKSLPSPQKSLPLLPVHKTLQRTSEKLKSDLSRKARSSLKHFKALGLQDCSRSKLWTYFPGHAYAFHESKEFLQACKSGNHILVESFLAVNPWLAHSFDYSRVSAIHWGVIRGHLKVVQVLLRHKVWVDVGDFVRFMQAGRTPIFLAAKYGKIDIFLCLLKNLADPFIKTRAQTSVVQVAKDVKIVKILEIVKTKLYFKNKILNIRS